MKWIKQNYEGFTVGLISGLLIAITYSTISDTVVKVALVLAKDY